MLGFMVSNAMAQEIQLTHSGNGHAPTETVRDDGGEWIKYWASGVNDNALGLNSQSNWYAAIRWMPEDLGPYEGYSVTRIRVFINDEPDHGSVIIWQGDINELSLMVSQTMMVTSEDWVEVELFDPYLIDTSQELWIGWEIGDPGDGFFPAAFETSTAHDQKANLLQFGDNPWNFASAFGFETVWNIEAYVVSDDPVETYTVSFHVKDEEGEDIENATIVLGPFEGEPGEYVFEGAPVGTHEYTVTAPGYVTVTGEVEVVDEDVDVEIVMEEAEVIYYDVTFNVDMTDVEGFDPDEHHVFLTGNFTGWAEPGTEGSLTLELVEQDPAKDDAPPYNFYENFEGYDDFTTDLSPWITIQLTEGNTWGAGDFDFPGEGTAFAWMAFNPSQTEPPIDETDPPVDGSKVGMAIQYMDFNDDKWLISPEFSINETSELSFWARSHTHAYGAERIRVLVSSTGSDPGNFIAISNEPYIEVPVEWTQYVFSLGDYDGEVIRFAINYVSEDAFIFFIDAIELSAEVDPDPDPDPDPDSLIYTVTTQVAEGVALYKYFSDAFVDEDGDGWTGGEWDGDPNREILVEGDMIQNDIWAVYETSIVEVVDKVESLNIYPNPASSILNISSDNVKHVAVYDITGRMLIQLHNTNVVNVSDLRNGLYIIQVTTPNGTEAHRFHVAR